MLVPPPLQPQIATREAYHALGVRTKSDALETYTMLGTMFLGLPEHIRGERSLFDTKSWEDSQIDVRAIYRADPLTRLPPELLLIGLGEQVMAADLVQVVADWVGRDPRLVGIKIGLVFDKIGDGSWLGVGAGGRDRDYRGVGNRLELVRDEFDDADH